MRRRQGGFLPAELTCALTRRKASLAHRSCLVDGERYSHAQIGWLILVAMDAAIVGLVVMAALFHQFPPVVWVILAILALAEANFFCLTVTVDAEKLRLRFGVGLIRFTINLADVASVRVVANPWYAGWGIRYMGDGWLFNVSGLRAVEVELKSGKKYRVGTDEPERLEAALRQRLGFK